MKDFYADFNTRLLEVPFVAGHYFSVADITGIVTVDFATKALGLPIPEDHEAVKRWYDLVSARLSITALANAARPKCMSYRLNHRSAKGSHS